MVMMAKVGEQMDHLALAGYQAVMTIVSHTSGITAEADAASPDGDFWVIVDHPDRTPLGMARTDTERLCGLAPQVPGYGLRIAPMPDGVAVVRYDVAGDPVNREWVPYPQPPGHPRFQTELASVLVPVVASVVEHIIHERDFMDRWVNGPGPELNEWDDDGGP
jgi:hypothetical protein